MARRALSAVILAIALTLSAVGANAQGRKAFGEGLAAYDAGDYETAARLWRGLAEAGDAGAQSALADLYALGLGFSLAADRGHMWARRRHEELSKVATAAQRQAAQRLAPRLLDNGD